eukprot:TRINITY_DN13583_c0_g1_i2.p1 TRINITY_DN13583_c0_g1~~TRINITY_DN13583_c0_g1_i2.p1  ORF type:complete len:136 (+),score=27.12 TRINITY_DN13583_c0_g1_i2:63-410(+)
MVTNIAEDAGVSSPSKSPSGSHSRAERARRQRIKQRMQHLQELVPGCKNMTGRAALDKIISYVMSLQNQIEVLSVMLHHAAQEVVNSDHRRMAEIESSEVVLPVCDPMLWGSISP